MHTRAWTTCDGGGLDNAYVKRGKRLAEAIYVLRSLCITHNIISSRRIIYCSNSFGRVRERERKSADSSALGF